MARPTPQWTEFRHYPATSVIWILAVVATLAWWGHANVTPLLETSAVERGELWRFITSTLLHGNVLHLMFNVFWWWRFATAIEQARGRGFLLALFVFLAIGSGAAQYAWSSGGIGLSGVVYGLMAYLFVARNDLRFAGVVDRSTLQVFAVWFVICIVTTTTGMMPVANMAHAAGAVLGAGFGLCAARGFRRLLGGSVLTSVTALAVFGATLGFPYLRFGGSPGQREGMIGYAALERQDNEAAVRWFTKATTLNPKDAWAWYSLGIVEQRLVHYPQAENAYSRAHDLDPNDPDYRDAYFALVNARQKQSKNGM